MNKIDFQLRRNLNVKIRGKRGKIELIIGGLIKKNDKPWGCYCSATGLIPKDTLIYGEDEIHALANCLIFCSETIKHFNDSEKKVWWVDFDDQGQIFQD